MLVLAVVSIVIGISRFGNPLPPPVWVVWMDIAIALVFFGDWIFRARASGSTWRYLGTHAYEVIFFVPYTLIPTDPSGGSILRGARLFRIVRLARFGRYAKLGAGTTRLLRRLRHLRLVAKNARLVAIVVVGVVLVSAGGAALFIAEGTAAGLQTYADGLWWSLSLFTTVAYAVPEPQTQAGRLISAVIMVAGVAYVGLFTASLASAILRTPPEDPEPEA